MYVKFTESAPAVCYSYDYLNALCVLVKYTENYESNQAAWQYMGGCFADGQVAEYMPAEVGKVYKFDRVQIEVRQVNDHETEERVFSTPELKTKSSFSWFLRLLSVIALLGAVAAGVLLTYVLV